MNNYHTHTYRCGHAVGDIFDYVESAEIAGLEKLGFTEHTPLPDGYMPEIRMNISEMDDYLGKIDQARIKHPNISIYKGLECEYMEKYHNFFEDELLGNRGIEYLICGMHFFPVGKEIVFAYSVKNRGKSELICYTKSLVKAMESGLFAFVAHPDLFGYFCKEWDEETKACSKEILQAAKDTKTILEINAQGWLKEKIITSKGKRSVYPINNFWEMASEYNISVIVNSDAHSPDRIDYGLVKGKEFALKYELNLVELELKQK